MKKIFMLLTVMAGLLSLPLCAIAGENNEELILPAAEAVFTDGLGLTFENTKEPTMYDETLGLIVNIADNGEITYTVPEGTEGNYDLYVTVSKMMAQFTSQPFTYCIGNGEEFSAFLDCQLAADAPGAYRKDGVEYNTGSLSDTGVFLIRENVSLLGGEDIKVMAKFGGRAASLKAKNYPALGDLLLVPSGTIIPVGYDNALPVTEQPDPEDPLSGLNIFWLGSSVTYGSKSAGHYSMADAIRDRHPGSTCEKYAICATTLVNQSADSYVARLKLIPKEKQPDLLIVQLSTNDATTGKDFGEIAEGFDLEDFDDTTIAGAIETILAYTRDTFDCPVVFYTGTWYDSEPYGQMVDLLLQIQDKWDIGVIDLYHNEEMTALYGSNLYQEYMASDGIHPTRQGYVEWWTPVIEEELIRFLEG